MKKQAFLTLAFVAAAGCSSAEETSSPPAPIVMTQGATPAQLEAFRVLEATTNKSWSWVQHQDLKTPLHLSAPRTGEPALRHGADAVKVTLGILTENKALFRMRDPAVELRPTRVAADDLGTTHARFQQMVRGIPVAGAELSAHYDNVGHLTSIDANYVPDLDSLDVHPAIAISDALTVANADVAARSAVDAAKLETLAQRLVVYASNEHVARPRLAYEHRISALAAHEPAIWIVVVDAKTGELLHRYDDLQTVQGRGKGVLGDSKQFEVSAAGAGFVMTAATRVQIRTLTAKRQQVEGTDVVSDDLDSWDTGVVGQGAAVDAHFNAAAVSSYYENNHGRNGIDGAGGALVSTVHFGEAFDNAAWTGTGMIYGDGGEIFRPLSVSLDVVGHEFTHGVTERTSKLVYENQSGALNEAVSDIFGAFIEHAFKPDETKNWQIGETVTLRNAALRDMKNPGSPLLSPQPAHMSKFVNTQQDNGGVHVNSGIINNAAFLMTVGGVNPVSKVEVKYGIGWEKSEKLWYRANTRYFMSSTNFGQAAQAMLEAAKDIALTQNEIDIVDCAFKATGVSQGDCAALTNPQSTAPAAGGEEAAEEEAAAVGEEADEAEPPSAPRRRRLVVESASSGCNAGGGSSNRGVAFGLAAAALALAAKRRRRDD